MIWIGTLIFLHGKKRIKTEGMKNPTEIEENFVKMVWTENEI